MSISAESQERWRRLYAAATPAIRDREHVGELIQQANSPAFWQTGCKVGSTIVLGSVFAVCYSVLSD